MKTQNSYKNCKALNQCDKILAVRGLLTIMKIMGLWQWKKEYANEKEFQHYQRLQYIQRFCIHVPITFTCIFLMWMEVFLSSDLDQAGDILYMSFTEIGAVVKVLNIWHHSIKAWKFINELAYGRIFELISPEEVELWQRKQKRFRYIVLIFIAGAIFGLVSSSVDALLSDGSELPFAYWVPFEWHTNKRNYWIAYAYSVFGVSVTAITNVSMNMIGSYFLFHTSMLYQILGMRLLFLQTMGEKGLLKDLRKLFQFHENVRRMTRECEALISSYVLSQIILSSLILCFSGYRMQKINILENLGQYFAMLPFLFLMTLEIFLPCYFGNQITWNSSQLCTQIYSSKWSEFSIPTRKLMILYMEFAKSPVKVKAGNYFEVGLPIFTKVMNNAYSFFALIMTVEK